MYVYTSPSPTSRCSSAGRYSATRRGLVSDGSILRRSMVVGRALGKGRPGVVVRLVAAPGTQYDGARSAQVELRR